MALTELLVSPASLFPLYINNIVLYIFIKKNNLLNVAIIELLLLIAESQVKHFCMNFNGGISILWGNKTFLIKRHHGVFKLETIKLWAISFFFNSDQ